jgi:hypothetical protein
MFPGKDLYGEALELFQKVLGGSSSPTEEMGPS